MLSYTVLTAAHVVHAEQKYQPIAPDGRSYRIDRTKIKILLGADLAVVSFVSSQSYRTVKVKQANAIAEGSMVYVGGFPLTTQSITKPLFNFTEGRVTASSKQPLPNGYGSKSSDRCKSQPRSPQIICAQKAASQSVIRRSSSSFGRLKLGDRVGQKMPALIICREICCMLTKIIAARRQISI